MLTVGERQLERCIRNKTYGSEREFLDFAEDLLPAKDYQLLERFIERGHAAVLRAHTLVSEVYMHWCRIFSRVCVITWAREETYIDWSAKKAVGSITSNQVEALQTRGWLIVATKGTPTEIQYCLTTESIETEIREALDILGLPFEQGLPAPSPPPRNRYERLMADPIL